MNDLISRQAAIDAIQKAFKRATNDVEKNTVVYGLLHSFSGICKAMVMQLPSAKPQEHTGEWIFHQYDANPIIGNWHCSECGKITIMPHDVCNFCPNCGARMEVDNDD